MKIPPKKLQCFVESFDILTLQKKKKEKCRYCETEMR